MFWLNGVLRNKTIKLCRDELDYRLPKLDKDMACYYLHQQNPYLRLGPFLYERLNGQPEVGYFHDMFSKNEIQGLLNNNSIAGMAATPYQVAGEQNAFSKLRTSKVKYINELFDVAARTISLKIQRATK